MADYPRGRRAQATPGVPARLKVLTPEQLETRRHPGAGQALPRRPRGAGSGSLGRGPGAALRRRPGGAGGAAHAGHPARGHRDRRRDVARARHRSYDVAPGRRRRIRPRQRRAHRPLGLPPAGGPVRAAVATAELAEAVGHVDGVEIVVWNGDGPPPEATSSSGCRTTPRAPTSSTRATTSGGCRSSSCRARGTTVWPSGCPRGHPLQRDRRARRRHRRACGRTDPGQPARHPRVGAPARALEVVARAPVAGRLPGAGARLRLDRASPGRATPPDEGLGHRRRLPRA